ncbi:prepilin-type N-terminal cleavage/methylation domain-containing protein [Shewanella sp. SP1S1-7]|uniref:prepilin-type N-terminal cleavage/methylation domain-containing protein n=1 Tax=Shewanella TaxID=22 RepID=UPI0007B47E65|nr:MULTISPECIES: prepilin-type N-terminal cleavage/methylation domain-containing protein [Shewanella]KZK69587.1 MSHA biogenesis protein MshB [Shewanella baltica]MDT3319866.1 prepilin-type N-terminal cleavage/methylation domain-containing protein [Shewanella sp. SP1S2-4]MDT3335287.1 prepilin-type N-terminal cleavage/methylation domain-containing protein [Shewanella sp. SP1S1-7]
MKTKQTGFSLIELVIVIVILGLLAATAIPRFLNVTDDAEDASVDGVAGGLSTAVSFVRSQWEVDGRQNSSVILDGNTVNVDTRFGYPTGTSVTDVTAMTDASCQQVFNTVLQSAPRNVLYTQDARNQRYTVRVIDGAGGSANSITGTVVAGLDLCVYHQVASLVLNQTTGVPTPTPDLSTAGAKGIVYNPGTGKVLSFTQTPFVP